MAIETTQACDRCGTDADGLGVYHESEDGSRRELMDGTVATAHDVHLCDDCGDAWLREVQERQGHDLDAQDIADATYTIRRPGCAAWLTGVRPARLRTEYEYAESVVRGHVIVGEAGAVEGEEVSLSQVEAAIREMED